MNSENFIFVDVENLSKEDRFLQRLPRTTVEKELKALIFRAIEMRIKNFYISKYAPSYDNDGTICFEPDKIPAFGWNYYTWCTFALQYKGNLVCSIGSILEYAAFLGVLIKKLINQGKSIDWAWNAVCNDSSILEKNFRNTEICCEHTGSYDVYGFCDLCIAVKMLRDEYGTYFMWLAGNKGNSCGKEYSIATLKQSYMEQNYGDKSLAWLVFRHPDVGVKIRNN